MDKVQVVAKTAEFVRNKLEGEGTGHDWWHIYRVWQMAKHIGVSESADMFIVELGALLHDIADWKFYGGDDDVGPAHAQEWLKSIGVDEDIVAHVCKIIKNISFKGAGVKSNMSSKEGMVVQDADRLDALGAIGIARTFAYGGAKGGEMYNPSIKPVAHHSFDEYKKSSSPTLNHFYEKLFLLKDRLNTIAAKKIAEERHEFMEQYVERFLKEWEGEI